MGKVFTFPVWLVLSLIWTGLVAYYAYTTLPHVPMDMSASDPATVEALRAATGKHAFTYGLIAAAPPALARRIGWLVCRRA